MTSKAQTARNRIGGLTLNGAPAEKIDQARRELREIKIRELIDSAPPLDDAERERIGALLRRAGGEAS